MVDNMKIKRLKYCEKLTVAFSVTIGPKSANKRLSPTAHIIMHMRTGYFVRSLMNQLVIENSDASLILIIRTGASV